MKQFACINARTSSEEGKNGIVQNARTANARTSRPAKNFHRTRNSIISSWRSKNDSLTSWSLPLFLNTIIRFLFSIASAAIFSITNSRTRVNQCVPARGCSLNVIVKCISRCRANFRPLLSVWLCYRYLSRELFQSTSTDLYSDPTSHSMRCTYT